jgi:hypothetical protein
MPVTIFQRQIFRLLVGIVWFAACTKENGIISSHQAGRSVKGLLPYDILALPPCNND